MSFEHQIQEWVTIDNQMKLYSEKIKELRHQKNTLNEEIIQYAKKNQLSQSTIHISDGKLKFINTKVTKPLTFKYIEKSLGEIIHNSEQVEKIMNYLKNQRDSSVVSEIKRIYHS